MILHKNALLSYDFAKEQNVLASNQEDASTDIGIDLLDKNALDSIRQDQIRWRDQSFSVSSKPSPCAYAYQIDPSSLVLL